jgi:hypothetical protein
MAKEDMICPFSGKLCQECSIYRGRHYYLCFCQQYRGYVAKSDPGSKVNGPVSTGANSHGQFEFPSSIANITAIDPFTRPLEDIKK